MSEYVSWNPARILYNRDTAHRASTLLYWGIRYPRTQMRGASFKVGGRRAVSVHNCNGEYNSGVQFQGPYIPASARMTSYWKIVT